MTILIRALIVLILAPLTALAEDLPSWNEGKSKTAIVEFVKSVTTEGSDTFMKPEDRIAVFDNDGTLWSEQPFYFQLGFMLDRIKALAPQHPEWAEQEPYKSVLAGDLKGMAASGQKGMDELGMTAHAGMTSEEFTKIVTDWFATAQHPKFKKPYNEVTFLPMRELLDYLRANGFKTYIVSGGGIEFMRPIAQKAYGIPPEQVIGSSIVTEYALVDNVPVLKRLPKISFVDDGPGKPVGINTFIGRRPIFVAGNSDGDYEMLRWVTGGAQKGFGMIVHHTDATREYAYDRGSHIGKLEKAMDEAAERNWLLVDMKNDWKKIYAFE